MTLHQEIAVALVTVLGASLSLAGSLYIAYNIVRWKKYNEDTFHRLLLGLCFCDMLSSMGWMMAPFGAPAGSSPRHLSFGNTQTCSLQGFLAQAAVGTILYNASLSVYYVKLIRYKFSNARIVHSEYIMHFISLSYGIGVGLVPLVFEFYNEMGVGSGCWLAYFPQDCSTTEGVECTRGNGGPIGEVYIFAYIIAGIPAVTSLATIIICNTLVYLTVRTLERRMSQYSISNTVSAVANTQQEKRTVAIASQAKYYVSIFVNSFLWQYLFRMLDQFDVITVENESSWTPMILLAQFFSASAGFGFVLTYIRPRYLRYRGRGKSRMRAFGLALKFKSQRQQLEQEEKRKKRQSGNSFDIELFSEEEDNEASTGLFGPVEER